MVDRENLPYRPCVGVCLFNTQGLVFVGERIDTPGAWQMPQGGMDEGELIEDTALRELKEEIGTDRAEVLKIASETICYDLPDHLVTNLWDGRFRGQKQRWVAMRFTGSDEDIDLNVHNPAEFSSWQWVELHKTLDLIVPFKRDVYNFVIDQFSDLTD